MNNYEKIPKRHYRYEELLRKAVPVLKTMDPKVEAVCYLPTKLLSQTENDKNSYVAIKYDGGFKYVDVTGLDNYNFLTQIIGTLDEYNVKAQPVRFSSEEKAIFDEAAQTVIDRGQSLIDQNILNGVSAMNTRLNEVLTAIALPNRSNRNGFYERHRLDAIAEILKDSAYTKIAATPHMVLYGRSGVTPGEQPILISSHSDIVPNITQVSSALENHVYHGTYDNLGTNAAAVMLMLEESLPDNVYLAFTDEEETGCCYGAKDASTYLEKLSGNSPLCIALDVTDEGFFDNRLITLEGLSASDDVKQLVTNAYLATEGDLQSCDVVKARRNEPSNFPAEYVTNSTYIFDEACYYAKRGNNTFSFCLPSDGYMHSNIGLDVKEAVFEGYILSIASFVYAYTNTHPQLIEAYKIAKDNLILEATRTTIPRQTQPIYSGHQMSIDDYDYEDDDYDFGNAVDLTPEEKRELIREFAEAYVDLDNFIADAMECYPNMYTFDELNEIFDAAHAYEQEEAVIRYDEYEND